MNYIVYKITNTINQKIYIGITTRSLSQRWAEHCKEARSNSQKAIHRAIRKYHVENFQKEIIDNSSQSLEELFLKEKGYIEQYNSFNNPQGYNCTSGGDFFQMTSEERLKRAQRMLGCKHTEETKLKISQTKKLYPTIITDEYRQKISQSSKGRIFTPESIEKRAKKLRGQKRTPEQKQKMGFKNIGRILTKEHRQKISQNNIGKGNKPFKMFLEGVDLGIFKNIDEFCSRYNLNAVSTSKILRKLITSAKGYSGYRIDEITSTEAK